MSAKSTLLAACLALWAVASPAQTATAPIKGQAEITRLLVLMDKDKSGKVSREEFLAFMAAEFDRLDVNKDGELDVNELVQLKVSVKHPGGSGSK